jgi:LCP family protein required for cell wall assembly
MRTRFSHSGWFGVIYSVGLFVLFLTGGCQQRVFVGLPTPSAPQTVAQEYVPVSFPEGGAPIPPIEPLTLVPHELVPIPAPTRTAVDTPAGPSFAWSETDNYLILGTDRRSKADNWRTDTIMVVGLDRKLNRAAVLSIPRDLYLDIPNYGFGRINQVDYIGEKAAKETGGGPALLSVVISETLGIATKHWVRFEMTGFEKVVDAIGGVTVHLDCPFYEPIFNLDTNTWDYFTLPAGDVHLDGEDAYWFVRLRLRESDIGRGQRQRQFLWALREQAQNTNLLLRFPELWTAFRDSFSTDLTLLEIIDLAQFALTLDSANVRAGGITLKDLQSFVTDRGAAVLVIADPARVQAVINSIWDAPAMADAYRHDSTKCAPSPEGTPSIASETVPVAPAAAPAAAAPTPAAATTGDRPDFVLPPEENNPPAGGGG